MDEGYLQNKAALVNCLKKILVDCYIDTSETIIFHLNFTLFTRSFSPFRPFSTIFHFSLLLFFCCFCLCSAVCRKHFKKLFCCPEKDLISCYSVTNTIIKGY